jgi:hypothetical protein
MEDSIRAIVVVVNEATSTIICTSIATISIVFITVITPVSTLVGAIYTPMLLSV